LDRLLENFSKTGDAIKKVRGAPVFKLSRRIGVRQQDCALSQEAHGSHRSSIDTILDHKNDSLGRAPLGGGRQNERALEIMVGIIN
jgi:hypothetical protein